MKLYKNKKILLVFFFLYLNLSFDILFVNSLGRKKNKSRKEVDDKNQSSDNQNNNANGEKNDSSKLVTRELSKYDKANKRNFKLFEAIKTGLTGVPMFQPLEFAGNQAILRMGDGNGEESISKCGVKILTSEYFNYYANAKSKIKSFTLEENFKKRMDGIVKSCEKIVEDNDLVKEDIDKEKTILDHIEKDESMKKDLAEAGQCSSKFKEWIKIPPKDLKDTTEYCKMILTNQGCTFTASELTKCFEGKKDSKGNVIIRSPLKVVEDLMNISIPDDYKESSLLTKLENGIKIDCKLLQDFNTSQNGKLTKIQSFSLRTKGFLDTLHKFLKCQGVYRPYMDIWNSVKEEAIIRMVVNLLTMSDLPKSEFRIRFLQRGFIFHILGYFDNRAKSKIEQNSDNKTKYNILMSQHFGFANGYLLRLFFKFFSIKWDQVFTPNSEELRKEIDGQKVFEFWEVSSKKKRRVKRKNK